MSITHIVLFQFKPEVAAEVVHDVRFLPKLSQMNLTVYYKPLMDVDKYLKRPVSVC